ncbi:MAG: MYG1 family protein [Clostridia bacterium]|nr:MYG1 family protein [Clostridia bacterium]
MINSIKLTKNINEANCITHSGTFHADEIFATLILSKIIPEITLIRVQEVKEMPDENVLVYDIGAGKYDHHQFGGNGERENGIKYAACGLIWKEFGKKLLEKYNVEDIDYTWNYIDKNLIQFIDSNDNGQLPKLQADYRNVHLSYMIGLFNSKWDEDVDNDENFMRALDFANNVFDEFLADTISKMKAKKIVDKTIDESKDGILILEKYVPWKDFIVNSEKQKAKDINFVVFPSKRGGYNVYAVPIEIGSFENRKLLPQSWRGKRDEELQQITGVKTARFCHNAGFICSCETMEDAVALAYKAT